MKKNYLSSSQLILYLSFIIFSLSTNFLFGQTIEEYLDQASDLYDENEYEKMLDVANKVIEIDSLNAKGYNYRGIYYDVKEDYEKAKVEYEKAKTLDESYAAPWGNLANIYMTEGKFDLALRYSKKQISLKPDDSGNWITLGVSYLYQGMSDSVIQCTKKAIELDEKNENAYSLQAYGYSGLNQTEEMFASLDQLIELAPTADNYSLRGGFYLDYDLTDKAFNDFNAALKNDPNNISALSQRAEIFYYQEKYEKCKQDALAVLEKAPEDDRSNYFLAWAEFQLDNDEESFTLAQKGVQNIESEYNYNWLMGAHYWIQKDFDNARNAYEKACEFSPFSRDLIIWKARSTVFSNTPTALLDITDGGFKFKEINSNNTSTMDEWVRDENHKYYFKKLLAKYNNDYTSLGLDEYFMLYYGISSQDDYSPYSIGMRQKALGLDSLYNAKNFEELASTCESYLEKEFYGIEPYFYATSAFYELNQKEKHEEYVFKGNMFVESIIATGDGKSFDKAWVVSAVTDEYNIMNYYGLPVGGQYLYHEKGHSYDALRVADEDEDEENDVKYYFNIDKPFRSLSASLGDGDEDESKKKKRKKKKRKKKKNKD